jgi:hypothetical protein
MHLNLGYNPYVVAVTEWLPQGTLAYILCAGRKRMILFASEMQGNAVYATYSIVFHCKHFVLLPQCCSQFVCHAQYGSFLYIDFMHSLYVAQVFSE